MMDSIKAIGMATVLLLLAATACSQGGKWRKLNQEARELYRSGKYDRAVVVAEEALVLAERKVGPDHSDVATILNDLALIYYSQGQYAQAEPLHKRALAIRERALGPDHPDLATSLNNLAVLDINRGDYAQAEPLLKRALAINEKALGPDHPDLATSLNNLAELDRTQGRYAQAEPLYKRSLAIRDSPIRYNVVHDVARRDYGGWGIYPDEGSHDRLIEKNLVYRCQDGALFAHHSRSITAENNIFAFNRAAQIERGGIGGFELACRRNIVYYVEGRAVGSYGIRNFGRDVCAFDRNLYWNASGKPVLFGNMSFSEWQALGQDKDSLIADPLFVDPTHGDFALRPDSPAAKIGFEPWDTSAVGPRPSRATPK